MAFWTEGLPTYIDTIILISEHLGARWHAPVYLTLPFYYTHSYIHSLHTHSFSGDGEEVFVCFLSLLCFVGSFIVGCLVSSWALFSSLLLFMRPWAVGKSGIRGRVWQTVLGAGMLLCAVHSFSAFVFCLMSRVYVSLSLFYSIRVPCMAMDGVLCLFGLFGFFVIVVVGVFCCIYTSGFFCIVGVLFLLFCLVLQSFLWVFLVGWLGLYILRCNVS